MLQPPGLGKLLAFQDALQRGGDGFGRNWRLALMVSVVYRLARSAAMGFLFE